MGSESYQDGSGGTIGAFREYIWAFYLNSVGNTWDKMYTLGLAVQPLKGAVHPRDNQSLFYS